MSLKFILLILGFLIVGSAVPANAMSAKAYEGLEKTATMISTPYANAKSCGLKRTANKLFGLFGKLATMCGPRETQLIKLERILGKAKPDSNCDDLDAVESVAILNIGVLELQFSVLDLGRSLGNRKSCEEYFDELGKK
ncbi:MAG: hypothetical protein OXH94_04950 [Rhodospirillales bacterium]|nr:hypothetical protein [Rhodospirillales bacterium]